VRGWDLTTGHERAVFRGHEAAVESVAFSPVGELLASGSVDGTARIWDLTIGQTRATLKAPGGMVKSIADSPAGQILAAVARDGSVWHWSGGTQDWPGPPDTGPESDAGGPGDSHALELSNNLARALATCPDLRLRKPARAVALAQAATRRASE